MDLINHQAIKCSESLSIEQFKTHANSMMRNAYSLDDMICHLPVHPIILDTLRKLKDCIKQLQHPILTDNHQISSATSKNIKYIYQCLETINAHLEF